jgi:hypothetical protein
MTIDSVTAVQYSGYFQNYIRKSYEAGKVNPDNEEIRVQRKLEEERKKIEPIVNIENRVIQHNEPRGYDTNRRLMPSKIEDEKLGKIIDILA